MLSLLFLVLLSCIIAPIRDLGNKFTSFSSNTISLPTFELPTVSHSNNIRMDIFAGPSPDNYDKVGDRPLPTKGSMSFSELSVAHYEKMELNNAMNVDVDIDNNSPALFYKTSQEKAL